MAMPQVVRCAVLRRFETCMGRWERCKCRFGFVVHDDNKGYRLRGYGNECVGGDAVDEMAQLSCWVCAVISVFW